MSPTAIAILGIIASFASGGFGGYIGVRVAIARLQVEVGLQGERLDRLEEVYFRRGETR